jgi:hypothetical protein
MKTLWLVLLLLMFPLMVSAEVVETTGDLRALIADIAANLDQGQVAGPGSEALSIPTATQRARWRAALDAVLAGDLAAADQALATLAPSYKVVQFTDQTDGGLYYLLMEARVTDPLTPVVEKGWGTYIINPYALRALSIQVPHAIFDADTETQGIEVFLQLGAQSFLLAGAHRCANTDFSTCSGTTMACSRPTSTRYRVSDVAHNVSTIFHQTHEEIMTVVPETVAIQLHGEGTSSGCRDVLISNTNSDYTVAAGGNVRRLAGNIDATGGLSIAVCAPRPSSCDLCGTTNVQGRFTNGSSIPCTRLARSDGEQFIHIEQSGRFRRNFTQRLIDALDQTFPY